MEPHGRTDPGCWTAGFQISAPSLPGEGPAQAVSRVFALDEDRIVVIAIHRGRSLRMGIEVEVEIVWLYTLRQGLLSRWQMFVSLDDAVRAAAG